MKLGLREAIAIFVLAAMPVLVWWFVLRANSERRHDLQEVIASRKSRLADLPTAERMAARLEEEQEQIRQINEAFDRRVASERELGEVLQEIWQLGKTAGLTTRNIRTIETKGDVHALRDESPYCRQPIIVEIDGEFLGIYRFLQAIEAQRRVMRIYRVDLRQRPQGGVQADIDLAVYFNAGKSLDVARK